MKKKLHPLLIFFLLGAVVLAAILCQQAALSGGVETAAGEVVPSGELALFHVRKLSAPYFQGRAPGTSGADRAAQYIAMQFRRMGCRPAGDEESYFESLMVPRFTLFRKASRWKPVVKEEGLLWSDNVLAAIGPAEETPGLQTIIISAHYDHLGAYQGNYFPGANDNASGVGVLLEAARVLTGKPALPCRVVFAAWTGEELGMYGSKHFASHFSLERVAAVINLDSLGTGDPGKFLIWTNGQDNRLLPPLEEAAGEVGIKVEIRVLPPHSEHNSDQRVFAEQGVPAATILSPDWLEKNHTFEDIPGRVDPDKLENGARLVVRIVEILAKKEG